MTTDPAMRTTGSPTILASLGWGNTVHIVRGGELWTIGVCLCGREGKLVPPNIADPVCQRCYSLSW